MSKNQAEQDAQMKEAIKNELATGSTAVPVKTQSQRDEEMKAQIKAQLAAGSTAVPVKTQSQRDEEMKAQLKAQLAAGSTAVPVKTQSQRDEEMKSQIKAQLAAGSTAVPVKTQPQSDEEMKSQIKSQLAAGSTAVPVKTQSQRDEELKSQIKAQLVGGPAPTSQKAQDETDEELKKIRAELDRSPEGIAPSGGSQEDRDDMMKKQIQQELANEEGESGDTNTSSPPTNRTSTRTSRRQRRSNEDVDAELKAQARASLEAGRLALGHSSAAMEPGSEDADAPQVGDNVSSRQVTSVAAAPRAEVEDTGARSSTSSAVGRLSTGASEKERPATAAEEEGERVGAFSVATRAYGGMPAWIRQQAQQNREAQIAQSTDESALPPEMRGLTEAPEQSELPPEMRMTSPPPEASPEEIDPEAVPTAEVAPVKTEDSGRKGYLYLYIFIAVVVIGGIGAGAGIALGGGGEDVTTRSPTRLPTPSPTLSPTPLVVPECNGYPDIDVDPANMDAAVSERYADLLALSPSYWPGYSGPVKAPDFCAPEHLALVWLANDDVEASRSEQSVEYRLLLSTIYFQTNGNYWKINSTNWLSEFDECTWFGVRCDANGVIIELDLNNQFVTLGAGQDDLLLNTEPLSFPAEVTFLTDLRALKMQGDSMRGTIPSSLGSLVNLEILDLRVNIFTGTFPYPDITSLGSLRVLALGTNDALRVTLPDNIDQWPNLEMVSFLGTGSGSEPWTLPTKIGRLSNLAVLNLGLSYLEGVIPTEIGNLSSLEFLNLRFNFNLFGTVPTEIGNLTNLKTILVDQGRLTGTIPTEVGNMLMLKRFVISKTSLLSGTIPTEIGRCSMLETVVLAETSVRGNLPAELSQLSNLMYLDLSDSTVSGTIAPEFFSLTNLTGFDVTRTFMGGAVAVDARNLTLLACLGLGSIGSGSTSISGSLMTEGTADSCEFVFEDSNELADCDRIQRESCDCCTEPGAICRLDMPLIEVSKCGYSVDSKQPDITDAFAELEKRFILS